MMCCNCSCAVELDAQRVATAEYLISGGTMATQFTSDENDQLAAARERDAAYLQGLDTDTPADAHRLRARLENRNRNWDDRRGAFRVMTLRGPV
jgi:hypothetical protein